MNIIETERLLLSRLSIDDDAFILKLLNDPDWLKFIGDRGVNNLEDARNYIVKGPVKNYSEHGFGLFLTKLKDDEVPIGTCGLLKRDYLKEIDIGFAFLPQFRGKGYAVESAAVIAYGKEAFSLSRIVAITQADNIRSIKVLKKIGFEFENTINQPEDDQEIELYGADV